MMMDCSNCVTSSGLVHAFLIGLMLTPASDSTFVSSSCCALKLMDSLRQVVIETGRPLTPGIYRALRMRVCVTDTVLVQIWTPVNNQTWQFKWQMSYTPSERDLETDYVTIAFNVSNLPTVATGDRLGLYGAGSSSGLLKLSVPYADNSSASIRQSQRIFNDSSEAVFDLERPSVTFDELIWQRTFESYVTLCTTFDCSDVPQSPRTPLSSSTELPFCGCQTTCSPDQAMSDTLSAQRSNIEALTEEINRMSDVINSLSSGNAQTGYCPDDFSPGIYGIGSCYIIYRQRLQLGEAAVRCSVDHGANLLAIESEVEQRFVYNFVFNNSTSSGVVESFWTAGMYSVMSGKWMWYWQDWTPRSPIASNTYRGWLNDVEPRPSSDIEACLIVNVDPATGAIYWLNDICVYQNYYICEIPKICY